MTEPAPTYYTTRNQRCPLGWTLYIRYCDAWQKAEAASKDKTTPPAILAVLQAETERCLNAHRVHQDNCEQCKARNAEIAEIGRR